MSKALKLPEPDEQRWTAKRKAAVVVAIEENRLSSEQACETYGLSADELNQWSALYKSVGLKALRVTQCQDYR